MADPTLTDKMLISLGDGGDPTETFAHPCGANARNVTFTNNLGEETTLDCTDPIGQPAAIQRWIESQDSAISISGRVARESWDTWRQWIDAPNNEAAVKNVRVELDNNVTDGGGYWLIPMLPQNFELGTEGKSTVSFSVDLVASGRRVWTDAA